MDLTMLANLAEVISTVTIVGGGIFALVQLSEFRAQRRQDVAIQILRSFAEWFNWLADQLARRSEKKESSPAYVIHAEWHPTR